MSNVKLLKSDLERVERLLKAMAAELGALGIEITMLDTVPAFWVGVDAGNDEQVYYGGDTLEEAYTNALNEVSNDV